MRVWVTQGRFSRGQVKLNSKLSLDMLWKHPLLAGSTCVAGHETRCVYYMLYMS